MNVFRNPFTWFTFYLMNDVRFRFVIGFRMPLLNLFISRVEYKLYTYFLSITYFIICTFLHPPLPYRKKDLKRSHLCVLPRSIFNSVSLIANKMTSL
jgi:hypothetical protein